MLSTEEKQAEHTAVPDVALVMITHISFCEAKLLWRVQRAAARGLFQQDGSQELLQARS